MPSAAKIAAYSVPITPAPSTNMERGMRGSLRMVTESNTVSTSNGTSAGRFGEVPVAMITTSPESTIRVCPWLPTTAIRCGSTNFPRPLNTSTL